MEKFFNTAGPCFPAEHYMLPALDRLPEIRQLVALRRYFVIHAPRQTGKTTALKALVREINAKGDMVALYCTLETLQNAKDPARAATVIASLLRSNAEQSLPVLFPPEPPCAIGDNPLCGGASETARPYEGASIGINVKRSRGAKGSETDETSPTRRAVCGKPARTVR